ncbi:bifunctional 4-hydroxy-2-oxoglutarate aldolase/2-dehydro-3-deoxy-phosphogluconate aldolase [Rathayibacter caricis]|uniref:bifunctional 4-hydroxy-2-oxoglutarate aldolase/2-dehydro-3-deoxy-phosphogluconate aldolase n=1 Tax=Rathayibacter caricis TaxID=110936 RepID=UPI001FB49060|nr:bifunctional 4-hydroxy-2-oxoglutarate aldolase/2-dehydro-3-deoxy-phosphogluconate aldolase [Rathayibacter caricis]MCJ1697777.1 bifunctional 4-hydroxy-2-oxoglutarate aldolase/2-dehydro-3-deoxy-phosphogluconate aldolase [Rathayibacter caricis]
MSAVRSLLVLEDARVLPVVVIDDAGHAEGLARALLAGGIPCAEVTLRTDAGLDAISAMSAVEGFTVVAGTVLTAGDAENAISAGAVAVVSPGLDEGVVRVARLRDTGVVPGIATATELQRAVSLGVQRVKFFPAAVSGGVAAIAALAGPFPTVRFLPSGGVTLASAPQYLAHPSVFAVSGSWMVPRDGLGDSERIRALAARTTEELRS